MITYKTIRPIDVDRILCSLDTTMSNLKYLEADGIRSAPTRSSLIQAMFRLEEAKKELESAHRNLEKQQKLGAQ